MSVRERLEAIADELRHTLAQIDPGEMAALGEALAGAPRVFVAGAGRSGLAMRGFAMRLMHLGRTVYVVGETTTPAIGGHDLLLIGSGSGATASLVTAAATAKAAGAGVSLITVSPDSPLGWSADRLVTIPAPTPKSATPTGHRSVQPMGSLFEQSLALVLDAVVLQLMAETGEEPGSMFARHANLE